MRNVLNLPDVTLCCVDTQLPELAAQAMDVCLRQANFGDALLFTDLQRAPTGHDARIKLRDASHIKSIDAYSQFLLTELEPHIQTSHVLIVQWDGYIINPQQWRADFLACDYIGAPWPQFDPPYRVGNGGFSLRSKRLLTALKTLSPEATKAEDMLICRDLRPTLESTFKLKFADEALAGTFSTERVGNIEKSFGFHGLSNFANLLDERALITYIEALPDSLLASTEARGLIKKLIKQDRVRASQTALHKRSKALKANSWSEWRLRARHHMRTFTLKLK
jgi:hypothetical protein